jgi:hypothetical protein
VPEFPCTYYCQGTCDNDPTHKSDTKEQHIVLTHSAFLKNLTSMETTETTTDVDHIEKKKKKKKKKKKGKEKGIYIYIYIYIYIILKKSQLHKKKSYLEFTFRSSPQKEAIAPPIECPVTIMGISP